MGWPPEDLSQEWEIQGLLVGKEEATDRELATENKPSRSVLAYRMSKDVSQEGGTTKGAEKQGSPSRDTAPRNPGWVMVRNTHGVVRCAHQGPGWVEPPQSPFMRPARSPVSGPALRAALCQEESLPGHRGSPGAAIRRMSELSAGRAVPSGPAQHAHSTSTRHASDTPPPAQRRRHGNRIKGAERCLFSARCQETRLGGGRAHLPGCVSGGGGSSSLVTRVTDPREATLKALTSLPANDGSCFLAPPDSRTPSWLMEQSLPSPSIQGAPLLPPRALRLFVHSANICPTHPVFQGMF